MNGSAHGLGCDITFVLQQTAYVLRTCSVQCLSLIHIFIVPAGIEAEGAEVNPGAASHLLVYLELRGAAFVIDGVKEMCIRDRH